MNKRCYLKLALEATKHRTISKGGTDDEDNLIVACFECNIGKSNKVLQ